MFQVMRTTLDFLITLVNFLSLLMFDMSVDKVSTPACKSSKPDEQLPLLLELGFGPLDVLYIRRQHDLAIEVVGGRASIVVALANV